MSAARRGRTSIEVRQLDDPEPLQFDVTITDAGGQTRHRVSMAASDYTRLTAGSCRPAQCVEAAVRFLLDREPKEAILRRFDVSVISRHFPDFEAGLSRYIAGASGSASK